MNIDTSLPDFVLRKATVEDCPLILIFLIEMADYEKFINVVVASVETLEKTLFGEVAYAQSVIGEYQGTAVGYALNINNFSTFTGRPGIYLEDLYVQPHMRGQGFGKCLLAYLAKLAVDKGCTRVEWSVLDWNEPSIQFYRSIGAAPMDEWTVQRLDGEALASLAKEF